MSSKCDGIRCGKCTSEQYCSCMIKWPDNFERDEEKFYYEDTNYETSNYKVKINKPLVNLDDFEL